MSKQFMVTNVSNFDKLIDLATNGKSANTRLAYARALTNFLEWFRTQDLDFQTRYGLSRPSVMAYVEELQDQNLSSATINQRLAAIRSLTVELQYAAAIDDKVADAITDISNVSNRGVRTGYWLSEDQAQKLLETPDQETLRGKQQITLLALLMGCALRRDEASELTVDMLQQRNGGWVIANLKGKGGKVRTIPVSPWALNFINTWIHAAEIKKGKILRAVNKGDRLAGKTKTKGGHTSDGGLSTQAIYSIVKDLAKKAGLPPNIAPHDLRRTWGKMAYQQNAPLDQISLILGHSSITTTEIYLGLRGIDLDSPVYVAF